MSTGSNREIMRSALEASVIPALKAKGFCGRYPHFRKDCPDHIELILFQTNQYGGSFTVEVSAVFPGRQNTNLVSDESLRAPVLTAAATNERFRLPGMFDGWFYYTDVYRKRTHRFGSMYVTPDPGAEAAPAPSEGWRPVQIFDEAAAAEICTEVKKQLQTAFAWLARFVRKQLSKAE